MCVNDRTHPDQDVLSCGAEMLPLLLSRDAKNRMGNATFIKREKVPLTQIYRQEGLRCFFPAYIQLSHT